MTKNYYKILGVTELCSEQELKAAYRKLARKWHPDIAGNTEEAVNRFKEINEAYEILGNKTKRAEYDTINRYYNYSSENKSRENKTATKPDFKETKKEKKQEETKNSNFGFKWEEFVSKYKEYSENFKKNTQKNSTSDNQNKNVKYGNTKRGNDINTDVEITISEAISGTVKIINMLHTQVCPYCNGRKFINGGTCPHCKGKGDIAEHKRFTVKIPAGVKDNSKIRLSGEGEKGINGGKNGDLYITVHIKAPVDYKTDGNNILKVLPLTPYEAVLGCNVAVKTLDDTVNVKISPNTQNGQKIRLSGCGLNIHGKIGDIILTVEIRIPKNLSTAELDLYRKLQEISTQDVR